METSKRLRGRRRPLDSVEEGFAKLIQHKAFSKSFVTTREMVDDSDIDEAKLAANLRQGV